MSPLGKSLPNLPLMQERFWNEIKSEYKSKKIYPEFDFYVFTQIWGSTSTGFGGIGCDAMTKAYTTVIIESAYNYAAVFFGERLAYIISKPNDEFYKDLKEHNMCSIKEHSKYC